MRWTQRVKQLKTELPALYLCLRQPDTPLSAKLLAGLTLAYALSPIDLSPDFIPVLGYLDDVLVLPVLIVLTVKLIPRAVWKRCHEQARGLWADGRPKKWYFAVPIVLFWLLVLGLLLKRWLR